MKEPLRIPCVILRGGTSKGIFIKENDLPKDKKERDAIILSIFGSPDVRQIDGLAGADPLTSKLAIIGPSTHPDADVDYTFGQVSINQPYVDYNGNCGNISSGVGPFAIDESLVPAVEPVTTVRIHNTNTGKILKAEVEVKDGRALVNGDCRIDGVPGTGSPIWLDFAGTAGAATGKTLPTGNVKDVISTTFGDKTVSIVDVANPCVFIRASDLGMKGTERPAEIDGNKELLKQLEEIRAKATVMIGMAKDVEDATAHSPAFPMICMVAEPQDYVSFVTNETIKADDIDFCARLMFMQVLHKTYAGTATACTGVACRIPGTVINEVVRQRSNDEPIRIGHPAGVLPVQAIYNDGKVEKASFQRTARRIMEGYVYIDEVKLDRLMKD